MELKQVEAVDTLIEADNRFCATLFDFLGEWKTDVLDFMESSYKEDLSLTEQDAVLQPSSVISAR